MPHRVVCVALQGSVLLDLGIPDQVFRSAVDARDESLYAVQIVSVDGRPIRTSAGVDVHVAGSIDLITGADTVIVLPGHEARTSPVDPRLSDALLAAQARGARLASICTGAFVLAEVGLLDDRRATTYWLRSAEFAARFPRVHFEPDVLFVDDGILSSAGVAAGLDLCMHMVRNDFGAAIANATARRLVMPAVRSGSQAQYVIRNTPAGEEERMTDLLEWARGHLDRQVSIAALARQAAMSERTVSRRFQETFGMGPGAWLARERLDRARELLETTDLYVDEIAKSTGLGSASNLRSQFTRKFALSPTEYRRAFRPAPTASAVQRRA